MKKKIEKKIKEKIEKRIKIELQHELNRKGIHSTIEEFILEYNELTNNYYGVMKSTNFQTVPVIFKSLFVDIFNSLIKIEDGCVSIWLNIICSYQNFDGGSNSSTLFNFYSKADMDGELFMKKIRLN